MRCSPPRTGAASRLRWRSRASYANSLAHWSTNERFLLNLPMFGREQYHPDVDRLVGDFTSSLMLDVDLTETTTAAARARAMQEALHATARHASVSGLDVLRDMSRERGVQTLAPIVYTSALGLGDLFAGDVTQQFGKPVWTISQGPQVLIDAQATPLADGLMINWDVRIESFRPGVAEAMFGYHIAELTRLATDDESWDRPDPPAVSESSRAVRDALNATSAPASGDTLPDGFFRNAAATPDAPAVVGDDGDAHLRPIARQGAVGCDGFAVAGSLSRRSGGRAGPEERRADHRAVSPSTLSARRTCPSASTNRPNAQRAYSIRAASSSPLSLRGRVFRLRCPVADRQRCRDHRCSRVDFVPAVRGTDDLAYVLFTSGSTGEPKGVEVTHDAVMNTLEFINGHFEIGTGDRASRCRPWRVTFRRWTCSEC